MYAVYSLHLVTLHSYFLLYDLLCTRYLYFKLDPDVMLILIGTKDFDGPKTGRKEQGNLYTLYILTQPQYNLSNDQVLVVYLIELFLGEY